MKENFRKVNLRGVIVMHVDKDQQTKKTDPASKQDLPPPNTPPPNLEENKPLHPAPDPEKPLNLLKSKL